MADNVAVVDILAMLGLFFTAFFLWVAWEIITGRKALALLFAVGTFVATWLVAAFIGATSALHFLVVELIVAALVLRVARGAAKAGSS